MVLVSLLPYVLIAGLIAAARQLRDPARQFLSGPGGW